MTLPSTITDLLTKAPTPTSCAVCNKLPEITKFRQGYQILCRTCKSGPAIIGPDRSGVIMEWNDMMDCYHVNLSEPFDPNHLGIHWPQIIKIYINDKDLT